VRGSHILVWAVILTVVVLLNLPLPASLRVKTGARDGVAPFQNVLSLVFNKGHRLFSFVSHESMSAEEKERLLTKIAELSYQLDQTEFLRRDNDDLRKMVDFRTRKSHKLQLCEVVSRGDVGGWWQTVTLNKGSNEGIKVNASVVTTQGLVGRISNVSRETSVVLLITDPGCRASCRILGRDTFGIVTGTGIVFNGDSNLEMLAAAEPLAMSYVDRDYEIRLGDTVVTSGLGGIFPEGLVVGYVLKSTADPSNLYQRLTVAPAAKLAALRYVFVFGD